jgi:hypothetical protein
MPHGMKPSKARLNETSGANEARRRVDRRRRRKGAMKCGEEWTVLSFNLKGVLNISAFDSNTYRVLSGANVLSTFAN